jgi:hypothetical protein
MGFNGTAIQQLQDANKVISGKSASFNLSMILIQLNAGLFLARAAAPHFRRACVKPDKKSPPFYPLANSRLGESRRRQTELARVVCI